MNKYIGLLAFVALAWWWTSAAALTPTSRFGIRYAPADTLRVSGTARVDSLDSLLVGGRAVGTMVWQDTTEVFVDRVTIGGYDSGVAGTLLQASGAGARVNLLSFSEVQDFSGGPTMTFYKSSTDTIGFQRRTMAGDRLGTFSYLGVLANENWRGAAGIQVDQADTTIGNVPANFDFFANGNTLTRNIYFRLWGQRRAISLGNVADTLWAVDNTLNTGLDIYTQGDLYIGDNIDSASTFQLVVQSGTSFSRLDAGMDAFEITSDEALKTGFEAVNTAAIRAATLALPPPRQWQYRTEALRHEPHLALIRADSSRAAVEREVDERLAQEEQDGRTLDRATVAAEIRTARTASVVEQAAAYLQQVERRAAIKHTGWTAQELYPLAQVIRPESASPTSTRLTDRVIGLVVTTQAQQDEIDDLKAAVYDPELGGVPLVNYVLGLAGLVAALSGYVATLKRQVNDLEARIAALEGVAPNPPNPEEESKT